MRYIFYPCYTIFKRWKVCVLFFLFVVTMAGLYVWNMPWYYASTAQLIIKAGDQDIAEANSALAPQQPQQTSSEIIRRILNTHLGIFHSRDVIKEALDRLGVAKVYPEIVASPPRFFGTPLDAAIERLDKIDLNIDNPPNSNVLQISLANRNPATAKELLNTLIAVFMEKDTEVMRDPRTHFLTEQVTAAREKVDTLQRTIFAYKKDNGISSLEDERSLLLKQRDLLEQNLSTENTQNLHLSLTTAQTTLAAAEQAYLQVEQKYTADNQIRQRAFAAVIMARQQYKTLVMEIASNHGDASLTATWANRLTVINDRLAKLNQAEGIMIDQHRQLDIATQTYTAFATRLANADFTLALNQHGSPNIAVSQEPTLPYTPARPQIFFTISMGVMCGLIGGVGLCFLLEALDETIGLPDEVEPLLGLPVLATLDHSRRIKGMMRPSRNHVRIAHASAPATSSS